MFVLTQPYQQINSSLKNTILSEEGQQRVIDIWKKSIDSWDSDKPGISKGVAYEFVLKDYRPVCLSPKNWRNSIMKHVRKNQKDVSR